MSSRLASSNLVRVHVSHNSAPKLIGGSRRSFSDIVDRSTFVDVKFGGRQSVSGITATVFGSTGFMGRYVVNRLGRVGSQVVLPYRGDGQNIRHMKLMGELGQIQPIPVDFVEKDTFHDAVKKSNVVINLVGSDKITMNYNYHDANVKCVYRIAKAVAEAGVCKRFIHVSALGASPDSPSEFLRSKYEGEEVVKSFFPKAIILRPAPVFGLQCSLLTDIARNINFSYYVPLIESGIGKVQTVHVHDVAQAIVNAIVSTDAPGSTYSLTGPTVYSRKELYDIVGTAIKRMDFITIPVDTDIATKFAYIIERLPVPKLRFYTTDGVIQSSMNLVAPGGSKNLKDLGVEPATLESRIDWCMMNYTGQRDQTEFGKAKRGHINSGGQYCD